MIDAKKDLLSLGGVTTDQNVVLKFREAVGTSRLLLYDRVLNGSYGKPFLIEDLEYRTLCFTLDGCTQTEMRLDDPLALTSEYTRKMMGFLVLQAHPRRILMIGLGGGSLVKYCHRHLPTTELTAIEIDPEVIALRTHFYVPPDDERLQVINADGAQYVAQMAAEGGRTDVVLVDAYDQHGVAKAVMERVFFENAKQVLGDRGVFIFNLVAPAAESEPHIQLIRSVFGEPAIAIAMPNDGNLVIFAGNALRNPRRLLLARRNAERVERKLGLLFPNLVKRLGVCYQQLDRRKP